MERRKLQCGLLVDVATTEAEWQKGLAGIPERSEYFNVFDGMLFIFDETQCWAVTADQTHAALDAYWLDEQGKVVAMTYLPAGSLVLYTPLAPARYLLETIRPMPWKVGEIINLEPQDDPLGYANAHPGKTE